jgi:hypothetical protein
VSTTTVWESGLTCDAEGCGGEFALGEEIIYWYGRKLHQSCAAADAACRRQASGEDGDVMTAAESLLSSGARVILTRRQLRDLIGLAAAAGLEPVRKPDSGRHQWYGRMPGWSASRVKAGLPAPEVAGMWLDFLEAGRMPPLRARDLSVIVAVISGSNKDEIVTTALSWRRRPPGAGRRRGRRRDAEEPMTDRSDLVRAVRAARGGQAIAQAVAALDAYDGDRAAAHAASRELDLGARVAAQRLAPVPLHEFHSDATDWLGSVPEPQAGPSLRTAMVAEASAWYGGLDAAVRQDAEELGEQARGRARTVASAHGQHAEAAAAEFLTVVGYLHSVQGASGLPQVDQTVDPNNQPGPTPYPAEVFPTFGEDQDPFNGVETPAHQSGASSEGAPLIQQVMQQNNSGSGFGTGPEKPDEHDTQFDASNGYAEVPLGPPGQIGTAPAATDQMASSHPNPVAGTDQDAGAGRRQALGHVDGYSLPDTFGYRWPMTTEVMHPFHERCASAHWPDEQCGTMSHAASVAVGYLMNLDDARRTAACEATGVREGLRAVTSSRTAADLGSWHNRFAQAWNGSGRTADDTAVLHGFMAVVRPVLAESAPRKACSACASGNCQNCTGGTCNCARCKAKNQRAAAAGLAAGGVTEQERDTATHHLPGTDKFPVNGPSDVENAKHDIGRTSEPHAKVVRYINEMAREYHVAPVGHEKAASLGREPNFT